jgi:tetratricopeptide (TPR) repeat protein
MLFENWRDNPEDLQLLSAWVGEEQAQLRQQQAVEQLEPFLDQPDRAVSASVHAALIHLYIDLGQLVRAHELVQSLQALEPEGYRPPYFMGMILKRAGRLEEARDMFLAAVKRDEGIHVCWRALVECCAQIGDIDKGLTALQRASNRDWPDKWRRFWIFDRGVLYQQMGNYSLALVSFTELVLDCLARGMPELVQQQAAMSQVPASFPQAALGDIIDLLEQNGLQPFPHAGTLLGWWREGSFLSHDKDIDIMLPAATDWEQVLPIVDNAPGFRVMPSAMGHSNYISLIHQETGLVIDIGHHEYAEQGRVKHVWRIPGMPEEQCRRTMQSDYGLVRDQWYGRDFWRPDNPDRYLTEMYGDWQTPVADFDTLISGHHLVGFPDSVRCYGYNRLAGTLMDGNRDKGLSYASQILRKDPLDPLSNHVRKVLSRREQTESVKGDGQ